MAEVVGHAVEGVVVRCLGAVNEVGNCSGGDDQGGAGDAGAQQDADDFFRALELRVVQIASAPKVGAEV